MADTILQRVGSVAGGTGSNSPMTADITGATRVVPGHGFYWDTARQGLLYYLSAAAAAPTAYVGAAAGTPLLAVMNPLGSGRLISIVGVGVADNVIPSAAGVVNLGLYAGISALPTGTKTNPTNMLTQQAAGSAGVGFVNTAMTGSTAITLVMPLRTQYWATAAAAYTSPCFFDVAGMVPCIPGNMVAFGASFALTSAKYDAVIVWEEVPLFA